MPKANNLSMSEAKSLVIDMVRKGATIQVALEAAGRSIKSHENWRSKDKEYATAVDAAREISKSAEERNIEPGDREMDFAAWRKEFLGYDTFPHQRQWIDVLEGREPTPIEGCEWDKRSDGKKVIINVPPFHAKSQTITADYVTYKICMNPNIRVILVSKKAEQAKKFLYQITQRLTSNRYAKLQAAYAPEGGFRPDRGEGQFGANQIYVAGRSADIKDPTVEAIGMGAQIYGSRADLIILDDVVVGTNANDYEKQIMWIESEVENRLFGGFLLIVGTRLRSVDLYSQLRVDDRYLSGRSPWSYLRQPMVLSYAEDPKDWKTLWPRTTTPADEGHEPDEDGTYAMWDGPAASKVRDGKPASTWSLVYQQSQVSDDATFHPVCVSGSVDGRRKPGPLKSGSWGHPRNGQEGMYVIGAIDPAASGDAYIILYAVDKTTQKRWVLNAWVRNNTPISWYIEMMKSCTEEYGVHRWVIESNAYANWLIYDERVTSWAANVGIPVGPHFTSKNKQDPDLGVASMAGLFGSLDRIHEGAGRQVHKGDNLIQLPDQRNSEGIKALIEQLVAWVPGKSGKDLKMDAVMALWFAELQARLIVRPPGTGGQAQNYVKNPFATRGARRSRFTGVAHIDYQSV